MTLTQLTLMAFFLSPFSGSDQEKTFGPTISGLIHRHIEPERLLLWDSKHRGGRPDTMKVLKEAYYSWNAEGGTGTCPF